MMDVFAQHIARGAGNLGDDGGLVTGQPVQQAGLAGIGAAGDHHGHAVAQQAALLRGLLHGADLFEQRVQAFGDFAVAEKIDLLFGKVDRGLDVAAQFDQRLDQGMNALREFALQGTQRGARGLRAAAVDQVGNRLGLGEIELVVEEGAFGEFAGPRQTRAEFDDARQQHVHDHRTAVTVQFQHVFAGEGMRGGKVQGDAVVDDVVVAVAEQVRVA